MSAKFPRWGGGGSRTFFSSKSIRVEAHACINGHGDKVKIAGQTLTKISLTERPMTLGCGMKYHV